MLAYLNRLRFSSYFGLVLLLGCGSGVLQASGASSAVTVSATGSSLATLGSANAYTASLAGSSDSAVSWSVRGFSPNEAYGKIDASGVYTPPPAVPIHNTISVVATSHADPTKSSTVSVTILNPMPTISSVSATAGYHSTFLVSVKGGNYLPSSVVLSGGYGVPTTYVSPTELRFTLSNPPAAGTVVSVGVGTPAPGKTVSANYAFTVPATVAVTVTGAQQTAINTKQQYSATVTGTPNSDVTWSVSGVSASENYGSITAAGVYTPPATVPTHTTIAITATSTVDTTKTGSVNVLLSNAVPTITSATLTSGAKSTYLVDIKGSNYIPTSYVQYQGKNLPTTVLSAGEAQFTLSGAPAAGSAISIAMVSPGPGKTVSASYTATVPGSVAIQATGDSLVTLGKTWQFVSSVTGTTNTAVTWSISGASKSESYGTITATGIYTPPAAVPVHTGITITATSQFDPTKQASVAVTLSNPVPAITAANLTASGKGAYLVDVVGSNFMPASIVIYKYGVPTTYVSASHLQFTLAAPPAAGTQIAISVGTPAPGRTQSADFAVIIPGALAVSLTGAATATVNASVQYTATVTGTSNTAVTWAVKGASSSEKYGSISASGLYTPPGTVPNHSGVTIVATSAVDSTKSASMAVSLLNAVPVIRAATASTSGKAIQVNVTGSNFVPTTVVQSNGLSLATTYVSSTALTTTLTSPQTAGGQVAIVAVTPNPGMAKSASFIVQMPGQVAVSVLGSSMVFAGASAQYAATVTGTSDTSVTWSVSAASGVNAGTISANGLYTPPSSVAGNTPVIVTATSQTQPGSYGSATVQVVGVSVASAARLLDQSTFGPTEGLIAHVQAVGLSNYLDEQIALPATTMPLQSELPASCSGNPIICIDQNWWNQVVTSPDQLRQRVSMALTEILVVSYEEANSSMVGSYSNIMTRDAFANWSKIMKDMTLSPAMGRFLNMANSGKPKAGAIANENFARENMQLFNLGLYLLNQDGTLQTDSGGNPIPSYTEAQVEAFSRVFTGWTYNQGTGGTVFPNWSGSPYVSMVATQSAHDTTAKVLLNTTLPAGQTAEQDLDGAIQDVFNHPNVGPFITKQLIQHMVKSNPSPEYVGRMSAVFANDGNGVRGNMAAVIKAMLLDPEARAGDTAEIAGDGYLREPVLWTANILRALNAVPKPGVTDNSAYTSIDTFATSMGQKPFTAPTVFNFYPADWSLMNTGLNAPQFALETSATIMQKLTLSSNIVNNLLGRLTVDMTATGRLGKLASASNDLLLEEVSNLFLHGAMSAQMRSAIMGAISTTHDPAQRVRTAVYLVIGSPQYRVIH